MRVVTLAAACLISLASAPALALDASDCESAAGSLRSAAEDLEDAADDLDSATRREAEYAEENVRSKARAAMSAAEHVRSACEPAQRFAIPPQQIYDILLIHLRTRFRDTAQQSPRLAKIKDGLMELARTHSRLAPSDPRMTFAVAELLYMGAGD